MDLLYLTRRRVLPVAALGVWIIAAASMSRAQTPESAPVPSAAPTTPNHPKYAALQNELALYSPLDSPWAELKPNHAFESHLFNLLRAEARLWALQDGLAGQGDGSAGEEAAEISRIIHAQVLSKAAEALPLLQKTPNRPFAALLVHQLEAYPYEWKEDGPEELLPNLHRLIDPSSGKSAPVEGVRRKRKRGNDDNG